MHHCAVFANEESGEVGDGEVIGALDAVGTRDVEDQDTAVVRRLDALAGAQVLRLDPTSVRAFVSFDEPRVVIGDVKCIRLAIGIAHRETIDQLWFEPDQINDTLG